MDEPLTPEAVATIGRSEYRKKVLTSISDTTFPPGTVYQTPEGLRAEDEGTRCAWDVQGGIYPIRESVFQASYEPATLDAARAAAPSVEPLTEPPTQTIGGWQSVPRAAAPSVEPQCDCTGQPRCVPHEHSPYMDTETCVEHDHVERRAVPPAPDRAGLRAALEISTKSFHDAVNIGSVVTPNHPAVSWENCPNLACAKARAALHPEARTGRRSDRVAPIDRADHANREGVPVVTDLPAEDSRRG